MSIAIHAVKTAVFTLLVPLIVAGVVPQGMRRRSPITANLPALIVGGLLVIAGVAGYLCCAALFVQAEGTPAPIAPTKRAVVSGPYRVNRNPMYTSVVAVVFGQVILFRSARVGVYGLLLFSFFHLFVMFYEEPTLRRQFNRDYDEFFRRVPRWIPRLRH